MSKNQSTEAIYSKAWALYLQNKYPQAMQELRQAIKLDQNHTPSRLLLAQIHLFDRKLNIQAAIKQLEEIIRIQPTWNEGHYWLGYALGEVGKFDEAIARYREAMRLAPKDARPPVALGQCFAQKGWYEEAIKMYRHGLCLKPYNTEADVRMFLAEALVENKQIKEACKEWQRVIEMEEGWPSQDRPQKEAQKLIAKYGCKK